MQQGPLLGPPLCRLQQQKHIFRPAAAVLLYEGHLLQCLLVFLLMKSLLSFDPRAAAAPLAQQQLLVLRGLHCGSGERPCGLVLHLLLLLFVSRQAGLLLLLLPLLVGCFLLV